MLTCNRKKKCRVASEHFANFGHIHNSQKKPASQERVEASVSYGFLTPIIQVCLPWEATAAAQPKTHQGELKWSNCEERSVFTQSEPSLFNYY